MKLNFLIRYWTHGTYYMVIFKRYHVKRSDTPEYALYSPQT